jgi:hypothetical protein
MDSRLTNILFKKFKYLFEDSSSHNAVKRWGIACGNGWFPTLYTACEMLYLPVKHAEIRYYNARGMETLRQPGTSSAVEVERARLAVVEIGNALPKILQVKEKFGKLHIHTSDYTASKDDTLTAQIISASRCEDCGSLGAATTTKSGWIKTLCAQHKANRISPEESEAYVQGMLKTLEDF